MFGLSFFALLMSRSLAHVLECFQRRIDLHLDLCGSLELKGGLVLDLFYVRNDGVERFRFNPWSAALPFDPAWSAVENVTQSRLSKAMAAGQSRYSLLFMEEVNGFSYRTNSCAHVRAALRDDLGVGIRLSASEVHLGENLRVIVTRKNARGDGA